MRATAGAGPGTLSQATVPRYAEIAFPPCDRNTRLMLPAPLTRIRSVLGARLHLLQVRYEAAARMVELRHSIDRLESTWEEWRARESERIIAQRNEVAELRAAIDELRAAIGELKEAQTKQVRLSRAQYDNIGGLRERLIALRRSDTYAATFENRHPLISVPIATFNAAERLFDRAIASVRAQTYDRWEIVVVGDGCTDDTAARVEQLDDDRVRFVNLPFRTVYPDDPHERWLVSGVAPWNRAVELSQGEWIAPLDDDDELLPNHMETLINLALERRAEYVYGRLEQVAEPGAEPYIFSFPPELGRIGLQQALYLRGLSFFECDIYSWAMEEPADWNVIRRMRDAGVRMAATEEPVARHYLATEKRAWAS
jgi:Glycosyl transferase family 2